MKLSADLPPSSIVPVLLWWGSGYGMEVFRGETNGITLLECCWPPWWLPSVAAPPPLPVAGMHCADATIM